MSWAVVDSNVPEILKLLFERTTKGTRMTGDPAPLPENVIRKVPPLLTTFTLLSAKPGPTERATTSLTVPDSVTVWAFTLATIVKSHTTTHQTPMCLHNSFGILFFISRSKAASF